MGVGEEKSGGRCEIGLGGDVGKCVGVWEK